MARKLGKKRIAQHMAEWLPYRAKLEARVKAIEIDGAADILNEMIQDAHHRIESGDGHVGSIHALLKSTIRMIGNCESGYYRATTPDGGFILS
jgi:hypothetical protein